MRTRILLILSITALLGVISVIFLKYSTKRNNTLCPDGSVPLHNDVSLCTEPRPNDIGVETKYDSFICMEFKDKNKNYIPGEVIIGSDVNVSFKQIQELVVNTNTALQKENLNYKVSIKQQLLSGTDYVLAVPRGWESNVIDQSLRNSYIKYAELNRCNQTSPL